MGTINQGYRDRYNLINCEHKKQLLCFLKKISDQTAAAIVEVATDKRTDVWSRPSCIYTQIFPP